MTALRAMLRSTHGGTAAEFGLLTPLLLSFMIGTVDLGRFLWTCNRAEKATQTGVRFAVTNDIVPGGWQRMTSRWPAASRKATRSR